VAEVYPELVARDKDGQPETVMYQFLAPMLLNEVQKQRGTIDEQQKTIDRLEQRLQALEKRVVSGQ
jgi:polyhydroxyalkanoate synthesis regulator phasin